MNVDHRTNITARMIPPNSEIPRPIERKQSLRVRSNPPLTEVICKEKVSGRKQLSRTKSLPKVTPPPIHESPIIRGFHQVHIAADRGGESPKLKKEAQLQPRSCFSLRSIFVSTELNSARNARHPISLSAAKRIALQLNSEFKSQPPRHTSSPVQQPPRRTKSCLSSRTLRASTEEPHVRKTTRTVSFGRVEGVVVKNIARENKDTLWFSRDEYRSMRQDAMDIAHITSIKGTPTNSSEVSSRGLEKFTEKTCTKLRAARISVLEHNDLAMYALASSHAIHTARQLAQMDALDAMAIQKEMGVDQLPHRRSRIKLNP